MIAMTSGGFISLFVIQQEGLIHWVWFDTLTIIGNSPDDVSDIFKKTPNHSVKSSTGIPKEPCKWQSTCQSFS